MLGPGDQDSGGRKRVGSGVPVFRGRQSRADARGEEISAVKREETQGAGELLRGRNRGTAAERTREALKAVAKVNLLRATRDRPSPR